jgi:hypothetical protein
MAKADASGSAVLTYFDREIVAGEDFNDPTRVAQAFSELLGTFFLFS